jgi:hypothetical protein
MLRAQVKLPGREARVQQDGIGWHEQKPLRPLHPNSLCRFQWLK